ncbi:type VII secretion protein EccE [Actinomadura decatromicini]|uniref:Type VII secretion system protein EccE domain-containing protein n=1 Tax=Actinomadura decatromicini TaxID=2604572 RepID=A0A5D3F4G2_9ACTN|nr:type VII secretion protein EccE [Actinomadura decatromicini]TYK43072.1 hypothetical protein FXF68_40030 [Actinomadura decatromicini]
MAAPLAHRTGPPGAARAADAAPRPLPVRGTLLGLRAVQIAAWPPAVLAVAHGLDRPGAAGAALVATGGAVLAATLTRAGHRWGYQWLATALLRRRRPVRAALAPDAAPDPGLAALRATLLPELRIPHAGPARSKIGVIEDGGAWTVVISVARGADGTGPADLLPGALASVLHGDEITLSAVQVLVHAVHGGLGGRPRSELARIALRVDPRTAGPGSEALRVPSFQRTLRLRARRVVEMLAAAGLEARIMDAGQARAALLADAAVDPSAGRPAHQGWRYWSAGRHRHTVLWVRTWPRTGLSALQDGLAGLPAHGTVLSVTLAPAPDGTVAATALIRVITSAGRGRAEAARRAARRLARSHGARLVPLTGEHHRGVLATLPLARAIDGRVTWRHAHRAGTGPATAVRVVGGGLPLGRDGTGAPVLLPAFRETPTRIALLADARLAGVLVLRALRSGAAVGIAGGDQAAWAGVARAAGSAAARLRMASPDDPAPVEGTCSLPWLLVGGGAPAHEPPGAWCTSVEILGEGGAGPLGAHDATVVHRPAAAAVDALCRTFRLPRRMADDLRMLPPQAVALVRRGTVRVVDLSPTEDERRLLGH